MAFSNWDSYEKLLNELRSICVRADSFESFDSAARGGRPDLVEGEHGYAALVAQLADSGDYSGTDVLFEHLRLVAVAVPAEQYGMGQEWTGLWISADHQGAQVYADDRYAALSAWLPLLLDGDGQTTEHGGRKDAAEADPREQQVDEATGRWRRFAEQDGEYEYHHTRDDVWERERDGLWYRFHDEVRQWMAYDEPSRTWLDGGQWRPYELGAATVADAVPTTEPMPTSEPSVGDVVVTAMAKEFDAVVKGVRDMGISLDELSDDELFELFGQRAAQLLTEEVPEMGKQS